MIDEIGEDVKVKKTHAGIMIVVIALAGYLGLYFIELESRQKSIALITMFGIACASLVFLAADGIIQRWLALSSKVRWYICLISIGLVGLIGGLEIHSVYQFRKMMREDRVRGEKEHEAVLNELKERMSTSNEN